MKTKQGLKALQSHWYRRLAKEGFKDIEYSEGPSEGLIRDIGRLGPRRYTRDSYIEYYRLAAQYLYGGAFPSSLLFRRVWKRHVEGMTVRAIAKELDMSRFKVQETIDKVRVGFYRTMVYK